jgi:site-specific DNA-methyltransferase (adenine-specific)
MPEIQDESVHLVVTSPPYANLKQYEPGNPNQLGDIDDYDKFLDELDKVWAECARVLVPGGRICCVVGDVNIARSRGGRHYVLPLGSEIRVRSRRIGLDHLQGILWYKVANIKLEASNSSRFLGKPNLPGGVVKNDIEYIIFLRKPGGYRSPSAEMERLSYIPTDEYSRMFRPIWDDIRGASLKEHPAPFPMEVADRLVRMFSFVGDVVLDPFGGTGTTALAALQLGRSSITYEVERKYFNMVQSRLSQPRLDDDAVRIYTERLTDGAGHASLPGTS